MVCGFLPYVLLFAVISFRFLVIGVISHHFLLFLTASIDFLCFFDMILLLNVLECFVFLRGGDGFGTVFGQCLEVLGTVLGRFLVCVWKVF